MNHKTPVRPRSIPSLCRWLFEESGLTNPAVRGCFIAIAVIGLGLRLWGISWGAPHPDLPRLPDHYDEWITIRTMQQINRHGWDLNPEGAHLWGTLVFFAWHGMAEVLNATGVLDHLPVYLTGLEDPNYRTLLIAGRVMIVAADMLTLFLIFVLATRMTRKTEAGLWAAAFYAILPFQVIHTQFMRPHVVGNLFVVLMMGMAMWFTKRPLYLRVHVITGMILGMAVASLYQLFTLAIIPYFAYLWTRFHNEKPGFKFKPMLEIAANWRLFVLAGVALLFFFLGCPFLFLDFESARPFIESQANATESYQFVGLALFDLSKVWPYLVNAMPMSFFTLVIPAYASFMVMFFRKRYYAVTLPCLFFSLVYTYYATKGYGLFAARALLYLFPIFAVFCGIWLTELRERWRTHSVGNPLFWSAVGVFFLPAFLYTVAYVRIFADEEGNPYRQVQAYFQELPEGDPLQVGFIGWEWDRYHVFNFEQIINSTRHEASVTGSDIDYFDPEHTTDYLLLFNFDSTMHERVDEKLARLHAGETYAYVTTFSAPWALGPLQFDYANAPTDFRYPLPIIHLFTRR